MSSQAFEFESASVALHAANIQLKAVNRSINDVLCLLYVLADKLRENEETSIYASALGCAAQTLENLFEETAHEFAVSNQPVQADSSPENQAVEV